ncbi:LPXTG cell wall anchor domain-containing protein [Streptomyces sp. NPDC050095]|uniref:LPXTG cell wall anchor domain-containing protein n=1 Tax=unclassified Streptomyces TaxID=2593676 RepID=UPI003424C22C
MGAPHNGDSNGGTDQLKLTTTVTDLFTGDTTGSDEDTIKVDGLSTAVSGVPAEVTAGGPAATFDATVDNPTASKYQNVTGTLLTSKYASVQVLRSGTWKTLTPVTSNAEPDVYGFNVLGKDASLAEHSSAVTKVRVTYRKDTPAGKATVRPCVFVNQGAKAFTGTTSCGPKATVQVLAPDATGGTGPTTGTGSAAGTSTPTASATPSPSASPSTAARTPSTDSGATSGSSGANSRLASTGSSQTPAIAAVAGSLLLAGAGTLGVVARRRRTQA